MLQMTAVSVWGKVSCYSELKLEQNGALSTETVHLETGISSNSQIFPTIFACFCGCVVRFPQPAAYKLPQWIWSCPARHSSDIL